MKNPDYIPCQITNVEDCNTSGSSIIDINNNNVNIKDKNNLIQVDNLKKSLRSIKCFVNCPYCQHSGLTKVTSSYSKKNIICSIFTSFCWLMIQCYRGKDITNCKDVSHCCEKCGENLGKYNAC